MWTKIWWKLQTVWSKQTNWRLWLSHLEWNSWWFIKTNVSPVSHTAESSLSSSHFIRCGNEKCNQRISYTILCKTTIFWILWQQSISRFWFICCSWGIMRSFYKFVSGSTDFCVWIILIFFLSRIYLKHLVFFSGCFKYRLQKQSIYIQWWKLRRPENLHCFSILQLNMFFRRHQSKVNWSLHNIWWNWYWDFENFYLAIFSKMEYQRCS